MFLYLFVETRINDTEKDNENSVIMKKRGGTCSKGARMIMKAAKTRLPVEFNFELRRVTSDNESKFTYECGYIVRKNCSLKYKEWRCVPNEVRLPLRHKLTVSFLL